jgi:hypothetical protein
MPMGRELAMDVAAAVIVMLVAAFWFMLGGFVVLATIYAFEYQNGSPLAIVLVAGVWLLVLRLLLRAASKLRTTGRL